MAASNEWAQSRAQTKRREKILLLSTQIRASGKKDLTACALRSPATIVNFAEGPKDLASSWIAGTERKRSPKRSGLRTKTDFAFLGSKEDGADVSKPLPDNFQKHRLIDLSSE